MILEWVRRLMPSTKGLQHQLCRAARKDATVVKQPPQDDGAAASWTSTAYGTGQALSL